MAVDTRLIALCVVEEALRDVQYRGIIKPPAYGLRLALAHLYDVAGDDPGVGPRTREPFDTLWRLATGITDMVSATGAERMRSTQGWSCYAKICRMVRFNQTSQNDEVIDRIMGRKIWPTQLLPGSHLTARPANVRPE